MTTEELLERKKELEEILLKPEETDDFIRIPVRDCKVTATITISEKEGITALYCGKIKKIRTYIFSKKAPYRWTMKKALAWVKEHGKAIDELPKVMIAQNIEDIEKWIQWTLDNNIKTFMLSEEGITKTEFSKETEERDAEQRLKETHTNILFQEIEKLADEIKEIKEGRVLSGKNLKLVKDCKEQIDLVGELLDKLIVASEPPKEESILPLIENTPKTDSSTKLNDSETNNIDSLTKDDMPVIVEEVLKGISKSMSGQHEKIQKLFDKKRGKVS